ncbi:MAG: hypothetical protein MJ101_03075 [Clostridia bacterium]|nr:hypothetical protein [Clostridia bacterium]
MRQYLDVLEFAGFPVIIADSDGIIIYKNKIARRFLPTVRRGMRYDKFLLLDDQYQCVTTKVPYCAYTRALTEIVRSDDSDLRMFLFPMFMQLNDYRESARLIYSNMESVFELFNDEKVTTYPIARLSEELLNTFKLFAKVNDENRATIDMCDVIRQVNDHLSSGYRALGYRATVEASHSVEEERYFRINPRSLFHAMMFAAYVGMRISSNGSALIVCKYDSLKSILYFDTMTRIPIENVGKSIAELVPECTVEIEILKRMKLIGDWIDCRHDETGVVNIRVKLTTDNDNYEFCQPLWYVEKLKSEMLQVVMESLDKQFESIPDELKRTPI